MKKLYISMIFSNLVVEKQLSTIVTSMHNFIANFRKILDICKKHAGNLVNEKGNVIRRGVVPTFSDLEVVALSITAEAFSIDSEANALWDGSMVSNSIWSSTTEVRSYSGCSHQATWTTGNL